MKKNNVFRSSDFVFRPTSLAAAMQQAGLVDRIHLVREPQHEGTLRDMRDRNNVRPSVQVHLKPVAEETRRAA
jgi:hypothetical protein